MAALRAVAGERVTPRAGLSLMMSQDWLTAALPIFERGQVEAIEWTWDAGGPLPDWAEALVESYGEAGVLYGHSVSYSPMTVGARPDDARSLLRARTDGRLRRCVHATEHVGIAHCEGFSELAPLPMPMTKTLVSHTRDRLAELGDAFGKPMGLENLALALTLDDVKNQGELLDRLLERDDGPLLLDLHNIVCQAVNFGIDAIHLIETYPLSRVRELHVAGGRVVRGFRRDTHDAEVPDLVWKLLNDILPCVPNAEVVVLERMHDTLADPAELARDFLKLTAALKTFGTPSGTCADHATPRTSLISDSPRKLAHYQRELAHALAESSSAEAAVVRLANAFAKTPYASVVESFSTRAIDAAMDAEKKWAKGQ